MIFVEVTSSIGFAVVTSSLNGEGVELSLANKNYLQFLCICIRIYKDFEKKVDIIHS